MVREVTRNQPSSESNHKIFKNCCQYSENRIIMKTGNKINFHWVSTLLQIKKKLKMELFIIYKQKENS